MPDSTDPTTPGADPTGYCHWHKGPSATAVLIQIVEQNSGPGYGQYACAPCREQRNLRPLAEQDHTAAYAKYIEHTQTCRTCSMTGRVLRRCPTGIRLRDTYRIARDAIGVL